MDLFHLFRINMWYFREGELSKKREISLTYSTYVSKIIFNYILKPVLTMQARVAQSVERGTFNPKVVGSSPSAGVSFYSILTFVVVKLS